MIQDLKCALLIGFAAVAFPSTAEAQAVARGTDERWEFFAPYLAHSNASLRQRSVVILTDAVLSLPQPRCLDPGLSQAEKVLYGMRATELPILFDYCRDHWKNPIRPASVSSASHYEQVHRIYKVIRQLKEIETFAFDEYVLPEEETITRLALFGMALVYSNSYKSKLTDMVRGDEPLSSLARDALSLAGRVNGAPALATTRNEFTGGI